MPRAPTSEGRAGKFLCTIRKEVCFVLVVLAVLPLLLLLAIVAAVTDVEEWD